MEKIKLNGYDIILCDYNLGKGTNGQQFLEYMRVNDLLPRGSIFFMVTAENTYEKVVAAAEHMPDDYLLKPFTAAHFITRLEQMLDRQIFMQRVNDAYDSKNWNVTVRECDNLLLDRNKYFIEVLKVKAIALMRAELFDQAERVYEEILRIRELPWAKLGLARAKAKLGMIESSQVIVSGLMSENPQFLAGYDLASELYMQLNEPEKAMGVIENAMAKNPDNLSRSRNYAGMALAKGDFATAHKIMDESIKRHRYSPVREASDYTMLSRALIEQGKIDDALLALDEAKQSFKDEDSETVLAASSSIAWLRSGNEAKAQEELKKAMQRDYRSLPPHIAASIAEACYASGDNELADKILRHVLQNNPDDIKLQAKVKMVQLVSGKSLEEANELIQDSAREVIKINNEGVRKAKEGKYAEAIDLILGAAERMPQNLNIISNAALILAVSLTKTSFDRALFNKCNLYRNRVFNINPNHPKLAQIDATLAQVKEAA